MSEYGQVIDNGTVRFERLLPGPVDRVWQYLTDSQLRGTWLATGAMEPRTGGAVTLRFRHQELTDHDEATPAKHKEMENGHTMIARITRWEPPNHLAYTWDADSEVSFDLEARWQGRTADSDAPEPAHAKRHDRRIERMALASRSAD